MLREGEAALRQGVQAHQVAFSGACSDRFLPSQETATGAGSLIEIAIRAPERQVEEFGGPRACPSIPFLDWEGSDLFARPLGHSPLTPPGTGLPRRGLWVSRIVYKRGGAGAWHCCVPMHLELADHRSCPSRCHNGWGAK